MRLLLVVAVSLLSCGCNMNQVRANEALENLQAKYDSWVGSATKSVVASELGSPHSSANTESGEVWSYHNAYGSFTDGHNKHERFDKIDVLFDKEGVVSDVNYRVQR